MPVIEQSKTMTQGTIWKTITCFALPIFLGNLFQQLYNTVDSLIVGNFLGSNALAAVSSSGSLIFLFIGFLSGLAVGAGVVIAKFFGARDTANMSLAIHTTVAVGLAASVLMTAVGVVFSPHILVWMDAPPEVMADSVTYLRIYFAGSAGAVMYNILVGILQAVGTAGIPSTISWPPPRSTWCWTCCSSAYCIPEWAAPPWPPFSPSLSAPDCACSS